MLQNTSTTAVAPEFLTQNLSAAIPLKKACRNMTKQIFIHNLTKIATNGRLFSTNELCHKLIRVTSIYL